MPSMSDPERRQRLYAFVEGTSEPSSEETVYARLGLVLDCMDANAIYEGRDLTDEHLVIVRVLSTGNRLKRCFGLKRQPKEGDWYLIELAIRPGLPVAWTLSAVNDYQDAPTRTNVVGLWLIDSDVPMPSELRPTYQHSAVLMSAVTGASLSKLYYPTQDSTGLALVTHLAQYEQNELNSALCARVLDVGQASCIALYDAPNADANVIGFFDVGAPIWFHERSLPKLIDFKLPTKNGFVILSHWDFDHYAMAWGRVKELRELTWFAPKQTIGANGARFQKQLGKKLHYIDENEIGVGGIRLFKGLGGVKGLVADRNATGYVLRLTSNGGSRLLTGDVDYGYVPAPALEQLVGLTVPHHGGAGVGAPPSPNKSEAPAVASYGIPNRYRHPNEASLASHGQVGWRVKRTAAHKSSPRQSHWL